MTKAQFEVKTAKRHVSSKRPVLVVLAGIRSRENVGSIFRTADAVGVDKIFLCGITPRLPHDKISKTALGAEEVVPWEYRAQTWRLLKNLNKEGYTILMLEQTKNSKNIFQYSSKMGKDFPSNLNLKSSPKNPSKILDNEAKKGDQNSSLPDKSLGYKKYRSSGLVLVLGNEVSGISQKLMNYATHVVEIPMYGTKESLNVAVAFGIAIYALRAQQT